MLKIIYCPICEENIRRFGGIAFAIYQTICEGFLLRHEGHQINNEDVRMNEIIRFLENKGFIITTEISQKTISCKPLGLEMVTPTIHYFCLELKKHSSGNG